MMKPRHETIPRRRRRWWRWAGAVAAIGLLGLAAAPWWVPAVAVRVLAREGVGVGGWKAAGWWAAEYREITYTADGVRVAVGSAQVPLLGVWPRGDGEQPAIVVRDVSVVVTDRTEPAEAPPAAGEVVEAWRAGWAALGKHLPAARVERIVIEAAGRRLEADALEWDGAALAGDLRLPAEGWVAAWSLRQVGPDAWRLEAQAPAHGASLACDLEATEAGGAVLAAHATWQRNHAELRAVFARDARLPGEATLTAADLEVPAAWLGLAPTDSGASGYGPVRGSVQLAWRESAYTVVVAATAEPMAGGEWPGLSVDVRAAGDLERVRVEAADVRLPGVIATLSRPLELSYAGDGPGEPVEFSVEADLGVVSRERARGRVEGRVQVETDEAGGADVGFRLAGEGLAWGAIEGASAVVEGRWDRPWVVLDSVVLDLGPDARSELAGRVDVEARRVIGATLKVIVPRVLLEAIVPDAPPCERIELAATAEGPWESLDHRGTLAVTGFEWAAERALGAHLAWSGTGAAAVIEGALELPGGGELPLAMAVAHEPSGAVRGEVRRLAWRDERGEWWRLLDPVAAGYDPERGEWWLGAWRLAGEGFEAGGEARLRWPRQAPGSPGQDGPTAGRVVLAVDGLEGARFGGVLPEAIRGGSIERLRLEARWDDGPLAIDGSVRATYAPVEDTAYAVEGEFVTREGGLAFGSIEVLGESGVVLRGAGHLPLRLEAGTEGFRADLSTDGAISLDLASEPNPVFWASIAELTGWTVDEPRVSCKLHGSLGSPRGEVQLAAERLTPPVIRLAGGGQLPELTGLLVRFAADEAGVSIAEGMVAIDNRWVTLKGHAPWTVWTRWKESGEIDWRRAQFELASNPLPIAIASRVFPTELAPVGEVSIRIAHEPGPALSGQIWLHGAALRPIGPLGAVREVQSQLDFEAYRMVLTQLEGFLGGQGVRITGSADLTDLGDPEFELHVVSSRVPLVRQAGLIVRAEMDLRLVQRRGVPAAVTGRLDFGPSLFDADLLSLLPTGGVETPESRPPYFSVEEEPFAQWTLDVAVHGEGFMRISTPFYRDLLSTDLVLGGTLGEPRVTGWVWGTGGWVTFPFGRIAAEQVLVTLSRENPYEPTLVVSGAGRVLGYDVRMEASGPANDPRLIFTSDPPLTSQQVFLMLTTGMVPDTGGGSGSSRASRLAFFIGRNLASSFGLRDEDRLTVRSGENFTREGRETVYVQYDLDGRWSIVGEYDRFDSYNGGLKFRLVDR